ncbi:cytochrome c [Phenylobacterium sp. J426]|uniref:c-type cytochrome n=1 Tax=Phenylobacterium sp. J426 TaxID=2898439 RepID=UPI0021508D56|nr:cytochrome c [Phenylobacterium sp. J426]MCR5875812.1 cytochrome c [Phenylobacterium sp. J426]
MHKLRTERRWIVAAAALAALAVGAKGADADEPGPGGARPMVPKNGAEVYEVYCQVCHMAGGKGAAGAARFPALAANARLGTAAYAIYMVDNGKAGMPGFKEALTPAQVAEVVAYLRTHFGNAYAEPVTASDVQAMRGQ